MSRERGGVILYSKDNSSILLVRGGNKWSFPKGSKESFDENLMQTAMRECYEETGITPDKYDFTLGKFNNYKTNSIFYYAVMKDEFEDFKFNPKEIQEVRWVKVQDVLDRKLEVNVYLSMWIYHQNKKED